MTDESTETQKTRPKKGEPIDIPIPSEEQIARDFLRVATATHDAETPDDEDD